MIEDKYNSVADFTRCTEELNDNGEPIKEWATRYEDVKGCLMPVSAEMRYVGNKETIFRTHIFFCGLYGYGDTGEVDEEEEPIYDWLKMDLTERDTAVIDSTEYRIKAVINPYNMDHHLELSLEIVT